MGCDETYGIERLQERLYASRQVPNRSLSIRAKNYPDGIYHAVYESALVRLFQLYELGELGVDLYRGTCGRRAGRLKERLAKTDPVDSQACT